MQQDMGDDDGHWGVTGQSDSEGEDEEYEEKGAHDKLSKRLKQDAAEVCRDQGLHGGSRAPMHAASVPHTSEVALGGM